MSYNIRNNNMVWLPISISHKESNINIFMIINEYHLMVGFWKSNGNTYPSSLSFDSFFGFFKNCNLSISPYIIWFCHGMCNHLIEYLYCCFHSYLEKEIKLFSWSQSIISAIAFGRVHWNHFNKSLKCSLE